MENEVYFVKNSWCYVKKIANIQYTFKEYIEYWLIHIFIENTDTKTKVIGLWAVRNLIEPNIEQDILLPYVTADYINDIIKRCVPICQCMPMGSFQGTFEIL